MNRQNSKGIHPPNSRDFREARVDAGDIPFELYLEKYFEFNTF